MSKVLRRSAEPACLEYAPEHDERFSVWGGLSERERRHLKAAGWTADTIAVVIDRTPRTVQRIRAHAREEAAAR